MKTDAKSKAVEIFNEHIALITVDQRLFRKTVMQAIMQACDVSNASAATHYNNAKKIAEHAGTITGLGRAAVTQRKTGSDMPIADNDCFTIAEVIDNIVTRSQSFVSEEPARKKLSERLTARTPTTWKLIKGLGPNIGDTYKLEAGEIELA